MKSFLSDKAKLRGFSIMELLVATAIFLIITGFVIANFRAGQRHDELELASRALASSLRQAQSMALAGVQTSEGVPNGFGVFIQEKQYQLFADFCGGAGNACDQFDENNDLILETQVLAKNLQFGVGKDRCIIFHLPDAEVVFNPCLTGTQEEIGEEIFIIKHLITDQEKKVSVNFLGQINEE